MARTVNGPSAGATRWYTPSAFGNRQDENPVRVHMCNPSERERRELYMDLGTQFDLDGDGNPINIRHNDKGAEKMQDAAIARHVVAIENYSAAGGKPITNAEELLEHGELPFLTEIAHEVLGALSLSKGERKNSEGSSPCSEPVTPHSNGTVASACETETTKTEAA